MLLGTGQTKSGRSLPKGGFRPQETSSLHPPRCNDQRNPFVPCSGKAPSLVPKKIELLSSSAGKW
jgi:hypothetical protein